MRRKIPYETTTFHYYNANPKNKVASDCVARAICTALGQSWETTIREITEIGIKYGLVFNEKRCYEKYLEQKGWVKHNQPKKRDNTKYTGREFCSYVVSLNKKYIARIGGHHIVAIVDGKVNDTWDSTSGCIGNYWTKQ